MLTIDGSEGEGGGQILRTSLALSIVTGTPFRLTNVRARREKPGLRRQHLTGLLAAARVGDAEVEGAHVGSQDVTFRPRRIVTGDHVFDVGTAGSAVLVAQAVLPALLVAGGPSTLRVTGGTHARMAPPWEFFALTYLPLVERMGPRILAELVRPGFFPRGGGEIALVVEPARLLGIELPVAVAAPTGRATAVVANLPLSIAEREAVVVRERLGWSCGTRSVEAFGAGNYVVLEAVGPQVTEVVVGAGERGVPAERVAGRACEEMRRYLDAGVPVGEHLADQLLLPMALARAGSFRTLRLTLHATTNMDVIRRFLDVRFDVTTRDDGAVDVTIRH